MVKGRLYIRLLSAVLAASLLLVPAPIGAAKAKKIAISAKSATVKVTNYKQLKLKNVPAKQTGKIRWKTSNKAVATVSSTGKVFTLKTGKATITATYKKKKYTCKITVKQGDSGYAYMNEPDLKPGDTYHYKWHYKDGLFESDGTVYQTEFAELAVLLCMSSNPDYSGGEASQSHRVKELLQTVGYGQFATNNDYKKRPDKATFGVAFGSKKITVAGKAYTVIAVVPRSAGYGNEWYSNLDAGTSEDHAGFSLSKDKLISALKSYIQEKSITGDIKLYFAGHSRGATVSNLSEAYLADHPETLSGVSYRREDIYGYNVATVLAADATDKTKDFQTNYGFIHNILMPHDLVPQFVPKQYGLNRYGMDHVVSYTDEGRTSGLKLLKKVSEDLYDGYTNDDPDTYADSLIRKLTGALAYAFPDRKTYMEELNPTLIGLLDSGASFANLSLMSLLPLLESDAVKKLLRSVYLAEGKPVPEDLFTEDGSINILGESTAELLKEFLHAKATILQHYTEVTYCLLSKGTV